MLARLRQRTAIPEDPVDYAREVLHIPYLWPVQAEILRALHQPPYRVMVKSGHNVGKSFTAAMAINHHYDRHRPGAVISTAPRYEDVKDILWKEVRLQRQRARLPDTFIGPAAPEMRTSPDHYAKGYTASRGESFQGRHDLKMLFVFDEAIGVDPIYWQTTRSMFKPELGHAWLVIFNPTDTTSQAYLEEQSGNWRVFSMSSLDHPNIKAQLAGEEPPVPSAISVGQVDEWVRDWCTPLDDEEHTATDILWRGRWHRPGSDFEARCLGIWPSQGTRGVWSEALWRTCTTAEDEEARLVVPVEALPQIGCDIARQLGGDDTAFHVRWGCVSLLHQSVNGWRTTETTGRLVELADEWAERCNAARKQRKMAGTTPQEIPIKVDDDSVGGGVTDRLIELGYNVIPIRSGTKPYAVDRYPNKRSELWFQTAGKAQAGQMWLGQLDRETLQRLKVQLMAPTWKLDSQGRRVVEPKDVTKEKLGRSPDDADAMNLAYYDGAAWEAPQVIERVPEPAVFSRQRSRATKRGLFGR